MISIKLNVIFTDPFWIGVFEKTENDKYNVCKVTFGSEPKDYEIFEFVNKRFYRLSFSNDFKIEDSNPVKKINPKRMQRKIHKETQDKGIGTKAMQALAAQREENKIIRKKKSKEEKQAELDLKFKLRQEKKLKKHKGH